MTLRLQGRPARRARRGRTATAGLVLLLAALGCARSAEPPRAEDGRIDLSGWDFGRASVVLVGRWSVCWGPLLEPGGRLLYVTCSVLAAENDRIVSAFLASAPDARENDVLPNNNIRDVMHRKARGYQVLPGSAGLDGFYFACLEKVQA